MATHTIVTTVAQDALLAWMLARYNASNPPLSTEDFVRKLLRDGIQPFAQEFLAARRAAVATAYADAATSVQAAVDSTLGLD